jgi:RNA polymerase sigma factor (sigma-70 family)
VSDRSSEPDHLQDFIAGFLSGNRKNIGLVQTRLSRYIRQRFTAADEEREDLVAEIMSILLLSLRKGQFRGTDLKSFNAYLYGIARLKIMQVVERNGRRGDLAQHLVSGDLPVGRITDPETRAMNTSFLKHIYEGLGEQCQEMIRMKFIQGWSDQEIADYRRMSKNALSTALSRCLKKARELPVVQELLYQKRAQ